MKNYENAINKNNTLQNTFALNILLQVGRNNLLNEDYFKNMLDSLEAYSTVILAYENEEQELKEILKKVDHKKIAIIIGAEGGFNKDEVENILNNKKAVSVSLGSRILRAETASLNLLSILMYEFE